MSNGPPPPPQPPPQTPVPIQLIAQTGFPPNYASRSKELIYDCLQLNPRFVKNPFGPQVLPISRPNHRWN
jgi:hypothetical protein